MPELENFLEFWVINSTIYYMLTTGQALCWEEYSQIYAAPGLHSSEGKTDNKQTKK